MLELPVDKQLIFMKSCRLLDVQLRYGGIQTVGHFWKVGRAFKLDSATRPSWEDDSKNGLTGLERWYIQKLAQELASGSHGKQYAGFAEHLREFLAQDASMSRRDRPSLAKQFKDWMTREIVDAMRFRRRRLYPACPTAPSKLRLLTVESSLPKISIHAVRGTSSQLQDQVPNRAKLENMSHWRSTWTDTPKRAIHA